MPHGAMTTNRPKQINMHGEASNMIRDSRNYAQGKYDSFSNTDKSDYTNTAENLHGETDDLKAIEEERKKIQEEHL